MISAWKYDKLEFRYLQEKNIEDLVNILHDPKVEKFLWFSPITVDSFKEFALPIIAKQQDSLNNMSYPDNAIFTIYDNNELIGNCGITKITDAHNSGLIGYQLSRTAWGKGSATKSLEFMIYYASKYLTLRKLFGDCVTANIASSAVMKKCGFTYEGKIKEKYELNGELHDNSWFGLRMCDAKIIPHDSIQELQ